MKRVLITAAAFFAVLALAQPAPKTYSYPGAGALYDGTRRANDKDYTSGQACLDDAAAYLAEKRKTDATTKNLTVRCESKTYVTNELQAPATQPPAPTTPGLGRLPANPRVSVGYSTERTQPTTEVARPAGDGTGDFRTRCSPSHFAFDDPIVFPGQAGRSHLHVFFGNTGANANSTSTSLRTTGNSTCVGGTINRSAYWVPAMIDTRTNLPVVPGDSDFYYKSAYRGVRPEDIRPMPAGLRMIAGDPIARTAGDPYRPIFTWVCHDSNTLRGPSIPDCPAGDRLELSIAFPQCAALDPVTRQPMLDSPDHKSHMAYADGGCPPSHPHALPEVSFHVLWPVREAGETRHWRLSSDTYDGPAGYSAHADWHNGWKQDVSDTWGRLCVQAAKDCHSHLIGDGRAVF